MKTLINFLQEGLKITSKSRVNKHSSEISEKIIKNWGLDYFKFNKKDIKDVLEKWQIDNKVNDVSFAADVETLVELTDYGLPKDIKNNYDDSYYTNEKCQTKLDQSEVLYSNDKEGWDIMGNKEMIAFVGPYGTLYCLVK